MMKATEQPIRIGISMGDYNGIGLETVLKTLADERLYSWCTPVIYGSSKIVSYHKNILDSSLSFPFNNIREAGQIQEGRLNVINCWQDTVNIVLGKLDDQSGRYAYMALEHAVRDLAAGAVDALVTAPINKKAMQLADFPFPGHTEYITQSFKMADSLMLMVSDALRVGLVTGHLPLGQVPAALSKARIMDKLRILNDTLKIDFGIERPKIGVLGLNPHAGDEGVLGSEEDDIIRPAIIESKKSGILALGPYAADGYFGSGQHLKLDATLAMYHDQGLVPFKALAFGTGVNYTAGLPVVRTSPDHGTGYDIAGKDMADPSSFRQALFLAVDVVKNRRRYAELHENALERSFQPTLESGTEGVDNNLDD